MKNEKFIRFLIERTIRNYLKEEGIQTPIITPIASFEDDPINFILKSYPTLEETLIMLLSKVYKDYITGIYITAPKPTTFKIVLHNGQEFLLTYLGKAYEATVVARRYYLMTIGDKEKAIKAIRGLLQLGRPLNIEGPGEEIAASTGTEQPAASAEQPAEGGGGEEKAPGQAEEEKTES